LRLRRFAGWIGVVRRFGMRPARRGSWGGVCFALLTVWLLREMPPVRFSARWLLVVLVMIVESYALERPALTWTAALGVALVAGGALGLLRADSQEIL
jgi:hypothetical protein